MIESPQEIPLQNPSIANAIGCFMMGASVPNHKYKILSWMHITDWTRDENIFAKLVVINCITRLDAFSLDQTIGFSGSLVCSIKEIKEVFDEAKPLTLKKTDRNTFMLMFDGDQILFEGYAVDVKIASNPAKRL